MVRGDVHPLAQVEAMRAEFLHAGVEVKLCAALLPRALQKPAEQMLAVALRARARGRYKVVHVENLSPTEELADAKPGDRLHRAAIFEKRELIALLLLPAHARHEFIGDKMSSQLGHDGKAADDLFVGLGDLDCSH